MNRGAVGIVALFGWIGLYIINAMKNLDTSSIKIYNIIIDLVALCIAVGYMLFSSDAVFGIGVGALIMLLIGGIFMHKEGSSNNISMLGFLLFFAGLLGIMALWRNINSTSTSAPASTMNNLNSFIEMGQLRYLGAFIAYALILITLYLVNPGGWMTRFGSLTVFISLFIGLLLLLITVGYGAIVKQLGGVSSMFRELSKGMYVLLGLVIAGLLMWWLATSMSGYGWASTLFNLTIFLGALFIAYKAFNIGGWIQNSALYKLVMNAILYIPCMFGNVKAQKWFKENPFAGTTRNDVVGLGIVLGIGTATFIITQWIIPALKRWYFLKGGKQLINEPVSLAQSYNDTDAKTENMTFQALNAPLDETTSSIAETPTYTYGISFWIYLDSFAPNTSSSYLKDVMVLNYGGVPLVEYSIPTNTLKISVRENKGDKSDRLIHAQNHVKLQRWNNVVINYLNGVMDVFYNGELVGSVGSISPPMGFDVLQVGTNNGVQGNMANVVYYKHPLSLYSINTLYTYLQGKSPPTV